MSTASARWIVMMHALLFVLGFTIVFVVVIGGLAGARALVGGMVKVLGMPELLC